MKTLAFATYDISPLANQFNVDIKEEIQHKINTKTKPLGALGQLEELALQCALVQYARTKLKFSDDIKLTLNMPQLTVFAGDHGVAAQGVSIAPSEVTTQMVMNFMQGGAAINGLCNQLGWSFDVVDCGILTPISNEETQKFKSHHKIISHRLGSSTQAINLGPAMTIEQIGQAFLYSNSLIKHYVKNGCEIIAFGEMGIGNTTSAAALMAALIHAPAQECVGKGTGVSEEIVATKRKIVEEALLLHKPLLDNPFDILACLGGFEIASMVGAMLAAAQEKVLVVVDGFICTAAAMLAIEINPNVKDYMVFAHCSGEQGHKKMLAWIGVSPLLNLDLRLGEGTGAALSLPIIQAAIGFYNEMASFSQAEVTDVSEQPL